MGTFSGVTSPGMVISSALGGTCAECKSRARFYSAPSEQAQWDIQHSRWLRPFLTSSGNSSPTKDRIMDVFPTCSVSEGISGKSTHTHTHSDDSEHPHIKYTGRGTEHLNTSRKTKRTIAVCRHKQLLQTCTHLL